MASIVKTRDSAAQWMAHATDTVTPVASSHSALGLTMRRIGRRIGLSPDGVDDVIQ
jgi:hypothetical protein